MGINPFESRMGTGGGVGGGYVMMTSLWRPCDAMVTPLGLVESNGASDASFCCCFGMNFKGADGFQWKSSARQRETERRRQIVGSVLELWMKPQRGHELIISTEELMADGWSFFPCENPRKEREKREKRERKEEGRKASASPEVRAVDPHLEAVGSWHQMGLRVEGPSADFRMPIAGWCQLEIQSSNRIVGWKWIPMGRPPLSIDQ